MIYNYGRVEVTNFLLSNALFWLDRYGVDGLRVDAVASMLYLDYSRPAGGWIPNKYGGRENIDAIAFLRRTNTELFGQYPHATTAAEESTAWPMVSRPVDVGGLGFGYKWNMGWMHDTLDYISKDPIYRRYHHGSILFGLHYAFSENFILPLSHDEVVHGKRSILGRMPGDRWQRFANLRAYYAFMYGHPGKKLMFMGGEFGQDSEWNHDIGLPWHLTEQTGPRRRAAAGARSQQALPRYPRSARARLRRLRLRMAGGGRCRPFDLCLAAQGPQSDRALRGRGKLHAAGVARLPRPGALRRHLARGAQFRRGDSMAAAMSETPARSTLSRPTTVRSSVLLSHRLLPSTSFPRSNGHVSAGSPYPLGANWDGRGTNFALFSANATKVELCLFDRDGRREIERVTLPERSEDIWHGYLATSRPGSFTAIACTGPIEPEAGHRFNPNKLLIDPYSKRLGGHFTWTDTHFGYRTGAKQEDLSFDRRDNARVHGQIGGGRSGPYLARTSRGRRRRGKTPSSTRRMSRA